MNKLHIIYNSEEKSLQMPEYGRIVQNMALYAITIEDDVKRQLYAERIIKVMSRYSASKKNSLLENKLWNHLWYITNGKLKVNYPCEIKPLPRDISPTPLSYPYNKIKNRHYGFLIETSIQKIDKISSLEEREKLSYIIANRMKRNLSIWKGGISTDEKVFHDLSTYSSEKLKV